MLIQTTLLLLLAPLLTSTAPTRAEHDLIHLDDLPPVNHHYPVLAIQVHETSPHQPFGIKPQVIVSHKNGYNAIHTLLKYDLSENTDVNSTSPTGDEDVEYDSHDATGENLPPNNTKHKYLCKLEFLPLYEENVKGEIPTLEVFLLEKGFKKDVTFNSRPKQERILAVVDVVNQIVDHWGDDEDPGYGGWPCDPKGSYYLEVAPVSYDGVYDGLDLYAEWEIGELQGLVVYVEEQKQE